MYVPLAFSLLNRFTHNLPLEAPLFYIPSLDFRRFGGRRPTPAYATFNGFKW